MLDKRLNSFKPCHERKIIPTVRWPSPIYETFGQHVYLQRNTYQRLGWAALLRTPWDLAADVVVLTDGLCGSACAALARALQTARGPGTGARVVTFGGAPEEAAGMDASAFVGGKVLALPVIWKEVVYYGLLGSLVFPQAAAAGMPLDVDVLPLPLPLGLEASVNVDEDYLRAFESTAGGETNPLPRSLPHELYSMPGMAHIPAWPWSGDDAADETALWRRDLRAQAYGAAYGYVGEDPSSKYWPVIIDQGEEDSLEGKKDPVGLADDAGGHSFLTPKPTEPSHQTVGGKNEKEGKKKTFVAFGLALVVSGVVGVALGIAVCGDGGRSTSTEHPV